ncbi:Pkr1-domain-containing protein [Trematosphaeria pertusa]|uniref:Pkr1-domain-containing protein n=1 Tax=Trematosphaeria pertusa TaxID=390896 RepID=A0A6A6ISK4_9PLEO|nr:Pkr1-domain-containing protein [Trematosphaeria pertusa]KAF2252513.1 Pkr1-domain-containing protein [Trematosphaeria pertusa]
MASFLTFFEQLWQSIFTPGPTPTLLVATNASFAALQLLLFALLLATHSIHFVILSGLTAGLWWAINWFAGEIRAAQAKEEEAKRIREARREKEKEKKTRGAGSEVEAMDSGDDTEVETEVEEKQRVKPKPKPKPKSAPRPETQSTVFVERPPVEGAGGGGRGSTPVQTSAGPAAASTTGATTKLAPIVDDAVKRRRSMGESTGELSTDSEWEKLSQDSGDR